MSAISTGRHEPLSSHVLGHPPPSKAFSRARTRFSLWRGVMRSMLTPTVTNDGHSRVPAPVAVGARAMTAETTEVLRVRDVMSADAASVSPDTPIQEIAGLLEKKCVSSLPVVDRTGRLVGIVRDSDLVRRVEIGTEPRRSWWRLAFLDAIAASHDYVRSHGRKARDVMTGHPPTTTEDEPLQKVAKRMARKGLNRLPVVRDARVIGAVSRSDLVRKLASRIGRKAPRECGFLMLAFANISSRISGPCRGIYVSGSSTRT